jgi:hypothetical protein
MAAEFGGNARNYSAMLQEKNQHIKKHILPRNWKKPVFKEEF